jgi:hypothetical protein
MNYSFKLFYLTKLKFFQGYTIPLDKRLAADGRGLQSTHINENFAKLAEALYTADLKVKLIPSTEGKFCFFSLFNFRLVKQ